MNSKRIKSNSLITKEGTPNEECDIKTGPKWIHRCPPMSQVTLKSASGS